MTHYLYLTIQYYSAVADSFVGNHIVFTTMGDSERLAAGCWSFMGNVGAQGGKAGQSLNLGGAGCLVREVVLHEVLHALGKGTHGGVLLHSNDRSDARAEPRGQGPLC